MASSKKAKNPVLMYGLIALLVIALIIGIYIYIHNKQKYEETEAKKLEELLRRKGWVDESSKKFRALGDKKPPTNVPVYPKPGGGGRKPVAPSVQQAPDYQCPEGVCPGLGKGFYLGKLDISDPSQLLGGSDIFQNITFKNGCEKYRKGGKNTKSIINTDSTDSLVSNISSENNIQGNFALKAVSVKPTIFYNTKYDASKHKNIVTSRLVIANENGTITFENNDVCRKDNLHPDFLRDFSRLPVHIKNPEDTSSWQEFYAFLNKWGSHVMTQITFGSRLEHWESHLDEGKLDLASLEAKACLAIEGPEPIADSLTTSLCSKYNKTKREEASKIATNDHTIIIGGTEETRNALTLEGMSKENIKKFIESSPESNQAIGYNFTPIWEIYQQVSIGKGCMDDLDKGLKVSKNCDDLQRCLNLEAAYAFDIVNCKQLKTTNDVVYQKFEATDIESPIKTYKCSVAKEGCSHTSTDCHYKLGGCKAYGPSAFEKGDEYGSSGLFRTKVRGLPEGGARDGINNSCNFNGIRCKCDKLWSGGLPNRLLWDQGDRY